MREHEEHWGHEWRMWRADSGRGRVRRTQEKRSMSFEEEGNASRGKEESKTHKRS